MNNASIQFLTTSRIACAIPFLFCGIDAAHAATKVETFPLSAAIEVSQQALNAYQAETKVTKDNPHPSLPPLASASFDFKVVSGKTVGGTINFFIFSLGASRQSQATSDVEFMYMPHVEVPPRNALTSSKPDTSLYSKLLETLEAAGRAVAQKPPAPPPGSTTAPLDFCTLTVTVGFGATDDVKGGVSLPILTSASLNADVNKNSTQTVKLAFKDTTSNSCKGR